MSLIYRTPDVAMAHQYCEDIGVQYLYVGPEERAANGPNVDKFATDRDRFVPVYTVNGVAIYRVQGMTARITQHGGTP